MRPRRARASVGSRGSLVAAYRGVVCDLDGVVYRASLAVTHAVDSLQRLPGRVVFATNNASRTVTEVSRQLVELGLPDPAVCTSAQAAARFVLSEHGRDAAVLVVGGAGLCEAIDEVGLTRVPNAASRPDAVVQGWGRAVRVADLADAAIAVRRGAAWIATNTDLTLPTPQGPVPGNGTLVAAVAAAVGRQPTVVGKPHRPLFDAACERLGVLVADALAIGDRLDTDIAGAEAVGAASLWVLTGVHGWSELAASATHPTYAAPDLSALHRPYPVVRRHRDGWGTEQIPLVIRVRGDSQPTVQAASLAALQPAHAAGVVAAVGLSAIRELRDGDRTGADARRLGDVLDRWFGRPGTPSE